MGGHQNNALGARLMLTNRWNSKWSLDVKNKSVYKFLVHQDLLIQQFIKEFFALLGLDTLKPIIKRSQDTTHIFITIFRSEAEEDIDEATELVVSETAVTKDEISFDDVRELETLLTHFTKTEVHVVFSFVSDPFFDAAFLGTYVADEIEAFRRPNTIFKAILRAQKGPAFKTTRHVRGIRLEISGRLNGVDRGRTVKYLWGSVPQNMFSRDISFAKKTAHTAEGTLGIKVWVTYIKQK